MRCLSVADAAKGLGARCVFACADAGAAAIAERRGHTGVDLGGDFRDLRSGLPRLRELAEEAGGCALVVDSYFADDAFLETAQAIAPTVLFDDFGDGPRPVDAVVNYNVSADAEGYAGLYGDRPGTRQLLGPSYAPLREQFRGLAPYRGRAGKSGVLVCVGGSDPEGAALRFARALEADPGLRRGLRFAFMLGPSEPDLAELRRMADVCCWMELREGVEDVAGLMCGFEAALSASGATLYELCACGLPTVAYCLSDDQERPLAALAARGAMVSGGDLRDGDSAGEPLRALARLLDDGEEMLRLSDAAARVVDGRGAERLAEAFLGLCGREREVNE